MTKRDFYRVLGVAPIAPPDTIRKAYRALSKQYHPDRNPAADAEQRMKELVDAYSHLNDREKRKAYDNQPHFRLRPAPRDRRPLKSSQDQKKPASFWEKLTGRTRPPSKKDPKQVELHFTLGLSLAANDAMLEQSRDQFATVLELDTTYLEARYNYALLCYRLGDFESARSSFLQIANLAPGDQPTQRMLRILA